MEGEDQDMDSVALDSPELTQVLDDSVKDIVLDSDDGGTEEMKKGGFMGMQDKNVTRHLDAARRMIIDEHGDTGISELHEENLCDANGICEKDHKSSECVVSNTESQEPGEPSHVDALDFIDHFLSVNNLNLLKKSSNGRADRLNSPPPCTTAMGAQNLARRTTLVTKARESKIYDWDEEQATERNFDKVLGEESDVGLLGQPSEKDECDANAQDVFDFGFDTQMAAEAMEALIYATPPHAKAKWTQGMPKDKVCNPSEDASKENESKVCADMKRAGSFSQINQKQVKNMKSSYRNLNGNVPCPLEKLSENLKEYSYPSSIERSIICREPLAAKSLNHVYSRVKKKNMHGRISRVISQQKEDGNCKRDNLEVAGENLSPSKFMEYNQHGEEMLVKEFKKSSYVAKGSECQASISSERSKDPASSFKRRMSNNLEFDIPKKRRTKKSMDIEVCKTFERKSLISGFDASTEARNIKRSQQISNTSCLFAPSSFLKLDSWCYPKQKRTHKGLPRHSNGSSNSSALFRLADDKNKDKHPMENIKSVKRMGGPLLCKSQAKFQSFPERIPSVHLSKNKIYQHSLPGIFKCETEITSEHMFPMILGRAKNPKKSGKSDIIDPLSSGYHSIGIESSVASPDTKASRSSKSNDEECKVPGKKILSRPSLMKELTRLGYNESLPNFMPRELRRRRNTDISVLFSQHLESNILNQQKKIIARLGFSIASCCSDATHFVTDRFVRTRNMLEAIAFGKPVVTHLWLESCAQANCFIDEKSCILRDDKKEREIGFSMPASLACARQNPLLKGRRVFITPNVKPGRDLILSLVKAVHGKINVAQAVKRIQRAEKKDEIIPDDTLILSSEEDYANCVPFLQKGTAVYDPELLLNGIVIQKLEFERHQLFTNYVET